MTTSFSTRGASLKDSNIWDEDQTFVKRVVLADGSIAAPSLTLDDLKTGLFKQAPGVLGMVADGVEVLRTTGVPSAINCFNMKPSTPGNAPIFEVSGTDPDIDIEFKPKGTGKVVVDSSIQIKGGSPALDKVLTSLDADGNGIWKLPSGGGFTKTNGTIILTNINDDVGIGVSGPGSKLHVKDPINGQAEIRIENTNVNAAATAALVAIADDGSVLLRANSSIKTANPRTAELLADSSLVNGLIIRTEGNAPLSLRTNNTERMLIEADGDVEFFGTPGDSVGGFAAGSLRVISPQTTANGNSVITGHNSFNGNTQLWYLGSVSSSNQNIALINRQNAEVHLHTNNQKMLSLLANGDVVVDVGNLILTSGQVLDVTIFAQLSSSVDQDPGDTNPTVITYNTQDAIAGLTHSTTVNPGEITVVTKGTYFIAPQPQVGKTSGATKTDFDMFMQVDRGSGFVDEVNSNIKLTIKDSDITDVIISNITVALDVGDKIRFMQRISSSSVGLGLKNTDAEVGPPTIPRTPAIIFAMYRIGG